ncbi:MAG: dihydrofolate reductase family protein [Candidatus Dormibacteraeota bacterium]|nr:dihydrofolate reductase family protein [Candidatus Dormibacteraeota bacterium]
MGTITVHEFITLDGVIESPSWSMDFPFDPRMGEAIGGIMAGCRAILLGRRTWEMFAPAWSGRTAEEDPGAPFMNDTPKYVVSSSNPTVEWRNSTVIGGYDPEAIRKLKESVEGGVYVSGSGVLVRSLLQDGLVDELHLFMYPLTLGTGQRLFDEGGPAVKLSLHGCEAYTGGAVHLTYGPAAPA